MTNLYWYTSNREPEKSEFNKSLKSLLFNKFKISENKILSIFFFDLVVNSGNYEKLNAACVLLILMLNRISQGINNLSDLFEMYIESLSMIEFETYIKKYLNEILAKRKDENNYSKCFTEALEQFEKDGRKSKSPPLINTNNILERNFFGASENGKMIKIGYNFNYDTKKNHFLLNPQNKNILICEDFLEIKEANLSREYNPIDYDFLYSKDYHHYFMKGIKQDFQSIAKTNLEVLDSEIINKYEKEQKKISEIVQEKIIKRQISKEDLENPSKYKKLIYSLIKEYRLPLTLTKKSIFDSRFTRYIKRTNRALLEFAKARESTYLNVISMEFLKHIRENKLKFKPGFYLIRRNFNLQLAKIDRNTNIVNSVFDEVPNEFLRFFKLSKKIIDRSRIEFDQETLSGKLFERRMIMNELESEKIFAKSLRLFRNAKRIKGNHHKGNRPKIYGQKSPKLLGQKSLSKFSTIKSENDEINSEDYDIDANANENEKESGFKVYLQKLKEIEKERFMKEKLENEKKNTNSSDFETLKKSLFGDNSLYTIPFKFSKPQETFQKTKPNQDHDHDHDQNKKFEKLKDEQMSGVFKNTFEQHKLKEKQVSLKEKSIKKPIDVPWAAQIKIPKNEEEWKESLTLVSNKLNDSNDKGLILSSLAQVPDIGIMIIENLLSEKKHILKPLDNLKIEFEGSQGPISKNYNLYLKGTALDHPLPDDVYNSLLESQMIDINFNKKVFKRILAHMIRYTKTISDVTVEAIIKVLKAKHLGITTLELLHLIMKNKIEITPHSAKLFIDYIKDYKILSQDIENLYKTLLTTYNWKYDFQMVEGYLHLLIFQKKHEIYMKLFENIKDFFMNRTKKMNQQVPQETTNKPDSSNKVVDDELEVEDDFEDIVKEDSMESSSKSLPVSEIHRFYTDFLRCLTIQKDFKFSKLVFYDFLNQKFDLIYQDYINGLKTFADSGSEFSVLYNQFKESSFFSLDESILRILIEAINYNPKELGTVFDDVLNEQTYQKLFEFKLDTLNSFILAFGRAQKFFEFTNFLRFLVNNRQKDFDKSTKYCCYRVLSKVTDDLTKPYIKGLIDSIFEYIFFFLNIILIGKQQKHKQQKQGKRS